MSERSPLSLTEELRSIDAPDSRVERLFELMQSVMSDRDASYSGGQSYSNIRACTSIGVAPHIGCFIRMQDKWSRLQSMVKSGRAQAVDGERAVDTALDLANYSLIFIMLLVEALDEQAKSMVLSTLTMPEVVRQSEAEVLISIAQESHRRGSSHE